MAFSFKSFFRGITRGRIHTPRSFLRPIRARYDSARTTADNARHWSAADGRSADAEANPIDRKTLRDRSRYEVANNSYAKGMVATLVDYVVGRGPRLQFLSDSDELNARVERAFRRWSKAVKLPQKLRALRMAQCKDGEGFMVMATNPELEGAVKLDLRLFEADRVCDPSGFSINENEVDGITFDSFGNPTQYKVLRHHPGGDVGFDQSYFTIPARYMIHTFTRERAEQHRGVPETTSSLPLFSMMRRYSLASLSAAEAAADFAGIIYTDSPASGEAAEIEPMDLVSLERNTLCTLPGGWKMSQLDPKQPTTTYPDFKREILGEMSRGLGMPVNVASGNSSGYNYASGRLDFQAFHKAIGIDRFLIESEVLDRIFNAWLREWRLVSWVKIPEDFELKWFWDGFEHVDPLKEASATDIRLRNHTTTLEAEYARVGRDWEAEARQAAKEKKFLKSLGLDEADMVRRLKDETSRDEEDE